jgi:hypothetical protein
MRNLQNVAPTHLPWTWKNKVMERIRKLPHLRFSIKWVPARSLWCLAPMSHEVHTSVARTRPDQRLTKYWKICCKAYCVRYLTFIILCRILQDRPFIKGLSIVPRHDIINHPPIDPCHQSSNCQVLVLIRPMRIELPNHLVTDIFMILIITLRDEESSRLQEQCFLLPNR